MVQQVTLNVSVPNHIQMWSVLMALRCRNHKVCFNSWSKIWKKNQIPWFRRKENHYQLHHKNYHKNSFQWLYFMPRAFSIQLKLIEQFLYAFNAALLQKPEETGLIITWQMAQWQYTEERKKTFNFRRKWTHQWMLGT